jgi:hypothetical protein
VNPRTPNPASPVSPGSVCVIRGLLGFDAHPPAPVFRHQRLRWLDHCPVRGSHHQVTGVPHHGWWPSAWERLLKE